MSLGAVSSVTPSSSPTADSTASADCEEGDAEAKTSSLSSISTSRGESLTVGEGEWTTLFRMGCAVAMLETFSLETGIERCQRKKKSSSMRPLIFRSVR